MQDLQSILDEALTSLSSIDNAALLEDAKARYLGKAGLLTERLKALGKLPADQRPAAGAEINRVKVAVEAALQNQRDALAQRQLTQQLASQSLDVSLPGRGLSPGGLHPVTRTLERIQQLFHSLGFDVADGPEIETDAYNFTALNIVRYFFCASLLKIWRECIGSCNQGAYLRKGGKNCWESVVDCKWK